MTLHELYKKIGYFTLEVAGPDTMVLKLTDPGFKTVIEAHYDGTVSVYYYKKGELEFFRELIYAPGRMEQMVCELAYAYNQYMHDDFCRTSIN